MTKESMKSLKKLLKYKDHYNNRGLFCDPNIIANNKEKCF